MPRLLIIAYTYPPFITIGAMRPLNLAKVAINEGWDVQVLSVANDRAIPISYSIKSPVKTTRAIRIPFSYFARWLRFLLPGKEILWSMMDFQYDWVPTAIMAGKSLYKKWPFDILFATAPPFSSLRVGASLSKKFDLPAVADLRDPFINSFIRDFLHPYIKEFWVRYYYKLLSQFDERIIVAESIIEELKGLSYHLIRNGYDRTEFNNNAPERYDMFTIGYIGTYYQQYNIESLFRAYNLLPNDIRQSSRLLFVGKGSEIIRKIAAKYNIDNIETRPVVPRVEAIDIMRRSHVLIFCGSSAIGTKIFEYAQTGAKSIQIYDSKTQRSYQFAKKYGLATNIHIDNIRQLADEIVDAYQNGKYDYTAHLDQFTRTASSKKILELLKNLV